MQVFPGRKPECSNIRIERPTGNGGLAVGDHPAFKFLVSLQVIRFNLIACGPFHNPM
jgi:hypothetical protein